MSDGKINFVGNIVDDTIDKLTLANIHYNQQTEMFDVYNINKVYLASMVTQEDAENFIRKCSYEVLYRTDSIN